MVCITDHLNKITSHLKNIQITTDTILYKWKFTRELLTIILTDFTNAPHYFLITTIKVIRRMLLKTTKNYVFVRRKNKEKRRSLNQNTLFSVYSTKAEITQTNSKINQFSPFTSSHREQFKKNSPVHILLVVGLNIYSSTVEVQ